MRTDRGLVFVIDDDESVREALSSLIRSIGLEVQTYSSATEWIERGTGRPPGPACLVLDVRMPGMSGLELQRKLAEESCPLPIVFITGHGDIPMTVRAIKAGAVEFLPKPFRDQDLLDAISTSLARAESAQKALKALATLRERFETLTAREREVLALLVKGLRNKLIASELGVSEVTVKVHRHNLMQKMRASSLPHLLGMVSRLGFPSDASVAG